MSIRCYSCKHPTCNSAPTFETLDDLRRKTRNPEFVNPRWTMSGLISFGPCLYVSNFDDSRLKVLRSRHDSTLAGHPGVAKTTKLVLRDYLWIGLRQDVANYVSGCVTCQRNEDIKSEASWFPTDPRGAGTPLATHQHGLHRAAPNLGRLRFDSRRSRSTYEDVRVSSHKDNTNFAANGRSSNSRDLYSARLAKLNCFRPRFEVCRQILAKCHGQTTH